MSDPRKSSEQVDHVMNQVRQLMEKWKNRLTLDNLRLSERYLKGEIAIFIFWDIRGANQPNNFCAVFEYGECPVRLPAERSAKREMESNLRHIGSHIDRRSSDAADSASSDKQEMMLVNNVKTVEFPEAPVPTVVRLERIDEAFRSRVHSLYFSPITGFVFGSSIVDGEVCLIGRHLAIGFNQLPCQVIERTPQIVNSIPGNQSKTVWNGDSLFNPMDFLSSLSIMLDSESIRISVPVDIHRTFQITNVMIGPFDFRPNID